MPSRSMESRKAATRARGTVQARLWQLAFDGAQEGGDPRFRARPHHFGDDVRIDQPGKAGSHSSSSSANASGL